MACICRTASKQFTLSNNYFMNGFIRPALFRRCSSTTEDSPAEDFEEMFRNSQFVKLGRPEGKNVVGQVTHVVNREKNKDIYVDFGWKFHAVQTVSAKREVNVGDKVEVTIKSLEATGHFLGQSKRITLNEAEATFKPINNDLDKTPMKVI